MDNLLSKIKEPWGIIRLIRLALALIIGVEAWDSETWWLMLPAVYFAYQSLSNAGCSTCPTPSTTAGRKTPTVDVDYEEVK